MFEKLIMASQMTTVIEENKRQRLLSEINQYDPKVVATVEKVLPRMAGDENQEYDISLIFAENKSKAFREQFTDLTGKFGYTVIQISSTEKWFLSTLPIGK